MLHQENSVMNEFKNYHPAVNFLYFTAVIVFAMFLMHPVCLFISLASSFAYSIMLNGRKAVKFNFLFLLPMLLLAALINPAFNHEGVTIIEYLPGGNPLTVESILYGGAAAVMIAAVICWFACYNKIMTSDKFIYLFGKVIPSLSLILSMALRFVPRFKAQIGVISKSQRCMGRDVSQGSIMKRAKCGLTILSIMVTWAFENAIETADSMKSRGYGLPNRTAFSVFRLEKRDIKSIIFILLSSAYLAAGCASGGVYFRYFPSVKSAGYGIYNISIFAVYFALCIMPVSLEFWEVKKWKAIKSKT